MKKFIIILIISFCSVLFSQHIKIPSLVYDHQALIVKDINASRDFYRDVLLMEEIENKAGDNPPKRWLKNAEGKEMHLIEGKTKQLKHVRSVHMAFSVRNMNDFMNHLKILNVEFGSWNGKKGTYGLRDDGAKQIYLQDPTGFWVEINEK